MGWLLIPCSLLFCFAAFNTEAYFFAFFALVPLLLFLIREDNLWKSIAGVFLFRLFFSFGTIYFVLDPYFTLSVVAIFLVFPICVHSVKVYRPPLWLNILSLPFLWVMADYLGARFSFLPTFVIMAGSPMAASPFLGLAKVGGISFLTFFVVLINCLIVGMVLSLVDRRWKPAIFSFAVVAAVLLLGHAFSKYELRINRRGYLSRAKSLRTDLVSASHVRYQFDDLLDGLAAHGNRDLLVLPENLYKQDYENSSKVWNFYKQKAKALDADLLASGFRTEAGRSYTSAVLLSKNGKVVDTYDKNLLTLTSDVWPFKRWRPFYFDSYLKTHKSWFELDRAVFDQRYQRTKGTSKLIPFRSSYFAPLICQELHYPHFLREMRDLEPAFMLHNSNNDWISAGLGQYLRLTNNLRRISAVWLNTPILVNGIRDYAGVIYPDGNSDMEYAEEDLFLKTVEIKI